jgi:hypothetical protein
LLVGVHVLGASLVWIALVHLFLQLRPPLAVEAVATVVEPGRAEPLAVATR